MNLLTVLHAGLLGVLILPQVGNAEDAIHWGYTGHEGPEHWGSLSPGFHTCADGLNQSPIDLTHAISAKTAPLTFNYNKSGYEFINNGHTLQINFEAGNRIAIDGQQFTLKQVHFHAPSENTINGQSFPMEAHFVHADQDNNLAVVGVMFQEGNENAELAKAWQHIPEQAGNKQTLSQGVNAAQLLPKQRQYYRYNGSLTTPPCSEGVQWYVLKEFETASKSQIAAFVHTIGHANNRPTQPLHARVVLQ